MPRANRSLVPGRCYHLTHRCVDRAFLLRFARDRNAYRERLRIVSREEGVPLLSYTITGNHVHLVTFVEDPEQTSRMVQRVAGPHAQTYNLRKERTGAFWEDRFHATAVDTGEHLWRCLLYIDLNMVRAGVVSHPGEWPWTAYHELTGSRSRYRLLDLERLVDLLGRGVSIESLADTYRDAIHAAVPVCGSRDPVWTDAFAVGGREFVEACARGARNRMVWEFQEGPDGWMVRESPPAYRLDSVSGGKNLA